MRVQLAQPSATPEQLQAHLSASFPSYTVKVRQGMVLVGSGAATGVIIKPAGPGAANLAWAFPSMAVQFLLTFSIIFTGILPGLIIFLITWLVVKGGVDQLKQEVATVLGGGAAPVVGAPGAGGGVAPGPFTAIAGALCFVMALSGLVSALVGAGMGGGGFAIGGIIAALAWIGLGVGLILRHGEDKRAFTQGTARSGPGLLIAGISAAVLGLFALLGVLGGAGLYMVRAIFLALCWFAAGALFIMAQLGKGPKPAPLLWAGGGVSMLVGLWTFYGAVELLGFGAPAGLVLFIIIDGLLWLGLGGMAFGAAVAAGKRANLAPAMGAQAAAAPPGYGVAGGYGAPGMQQGYPSGQAAPQQPGYPPGQPAAQQPGYPPGQPAAQQPGYPPGQPAAQQPGYPPGQP
ncbi:MAG: hypothetical protein JRI23_19545, partial [Deltaproteobacteria bacterium]|nr:hypothetical protein [Deltaproteobacteria bacterium]MBW2534060.1 hypothetical protein [Deltaproteobacteria bacterium]